MKIKETFSSVIRRKDVRIWTVGVALTAAAVMSLFISWYNRLPRLYEVIGEIETISQPQYFSSLIRFEELADIEKKIAQEDPAREFSAGFAVREVGATYWVCDAKTGKAYHPVPAYNILDQPAMLRILPDPATAKKFGELNGLYRCTLYMRDDPVLLGLTKVTTLYLLDYEDASVFDLFNPAEKIQYTPPKPTVEQRRLWMKLIEQKYPPVAAPVLPEDAERLILFHSVPQGLPMYVARRIEIEECVVDGQVDPYFVKAKILDADHQLGFTPFIGEYLPDSDLFFLFEFVTTNTHLVDDGQMFETVERLPDNPHLYRVIRGYPFKVSMTETAPMIQVALFQLEGLSVDELSRLADTRNTFDIDEELFDVYIQPIFQQAQKELIDPAITIDFCTSMLAHAGKIALETSIGSYPVGLHKKTPYGYSVVPLGRSKQVIRRNPEVLIQLRDFIFRD